MKRRVRIREVHDLERLGWILLIFLGLLLAWASRAAALPDNRAWEMISPVDKNGGEIRGIDGLSKGGVVQASADGEAVTYASLASFGGSQQGAPVGSQYLSRRTPQGWGTENITSPTKSLEYGLTGTGGPYKAFSTDLSSALQRNGQVPPPPGLPAEYKEGNFNLRDNETGVFQGLLTSPPRLAGKEGLQLVLKASSSNLAHIGFSSDAALTPGATPTVDDDAELSLYQWSREDGEFHAVDILPGVTDGETAPNEPEPGDAIYGGPNGASGNAISDDGSRAFWTFHQNASGQALYVRENPERSQSPLSPTPTGKGGISEDSPMVTGLTITTGVFAVGAEISGEGIPQGTTITSLGSGTLTLSSVATMSATSVALTSVGACTDPSLACTVQIDASRGPGESRYVEFKTATPDGSRAFFTDSSRLTSAPKVECDFHECDDLYEFNTNTSELTDLTVDDNPEDVVPGTSVPGGAQVRGVLGTSADGSYVYFVALGAHLAGAEPNAKGEQPVSGADNLYVSHNGEVRFIATLEVTNSNREKAWNSHISYRVARVSADGTHLLFNSTQDLTGYDNALASGANCAVDREGNVGPSCTEVYLYNAMAGAGVGRLTCVSCNPSGARPQGPSTIPAGTNAEEGFALYQSRVLSEGLPGDGVRVFFDSRDALVPQDKNGKEDVYQWEADGTGGCRSEAQNGGCVSLISGGTYSSDSSFVDASESGDNVFFVTGQQLVGQDTDELVDLYDAREDGGIVVPPAAPVCSGTGCQGVPPAPPIFATPSSVTFNGVGNFEAPAVKPVVKAKKAKPKLKACRKGLVRKHGKCVKGAAGKRKSAASSRKSIDATSRS